MSGGAWIGADPGGVGGFGVAILAENGPCHTFTADYVDAAVEFARSHVQEAPAGIGIDAPLWWSSGPAGLRRADQWIRETYRISSGTVQAVNSLRGAALAQGMMFASRLREAFPDVPVTETHPKAVLRALDRKTWLNHFERVATQVTLDDKPDHLRDAIISAIAAREGFTGSWKRDLASERFPTEQDPAKYWLAPVHYFWPS